MSSTFSPGDRVRVRLPNHSERLADVVEQTSDPGRYLLAIDGDTQMHRVRVGRMALVRSVAQVRAAYPAARRQTAPPIVLFALAGAAVLVLIAIGAMLAQH